MSYETLLDRMEAFWLANPLVPEEIRPALHRDIETLVGVAKAAGEMRGYIRAHLDGAVCDEELAWAAQQYDEASGSEGDNREHLSSAEAAVPPAPEKCDHDYVFVYDDYYLCEKCGDKSSDGAS